MLRHSFKSIIQSNKFFLLNPCIGIRYNQTHKGGKKDGIDYLINDHKEVRQLFEKYKTVSSNEEKKSIANEVIRSLSQHASIEEQYLYPLMRKKLDGKKGDIIADLLLTDHLALKDMLAFLEAIDPTEDVDTYDKAFNRVVVMVDTHAKEEEEWLGKLRGLLTNEEIADLEDTLVKAKKTAPTRPHPMAPNKPETGAKIVHKMAGMFEKATGQ